MIECQIFYVDMHIKGTYFTNRMLTKIVTFEPEFGKEIVILPKSLNSKKSLEFPFLMQMYTY